MTNHHRASQRSGSPRSSAAYRRPRVRQSPSKPKPMRDLSASPRETSASAPTSPPQRPRTDTARDTFSLIRLTTGTTAKERGLHMPLILAGVAAFFAGIAFTLLSRR